MPPQYTASHQQDIPAQHEFLPGDGHRNGTEPPTLEDLYPVGEATQAEDPGNTPEISSPQPLTGADSPVQPPPPGKRYRGRGRGVRCSLPAQLVKDDERLPISLGPRTPPGAGLGG